MAALRSPIDEEDCDAPLLSMKEKAAKSASKQKHERLPFVRVAVPQSH